MVCQSSRFLRFWLLETWRSWLLWTSCLTFADFLILWSSRLYMVLKFSMLLVVFRNLSSSRLSRQLYLSWKPYTFKGENIHNQLFTYYILENSFLKRQFHESKADSLWRVLTSKDQSLPPDDLKNHLIYVDLIQMISLGLCNMSLECIVSPLFSRLYSLLFPTKVTVWRIICVH